ncbi:hypothetical protein [Pseudomonas asiatica]
MERIAFKACAVPVEDLDFSPMRTTFFNLPLNRVIELGTQVEI